MAEPTAAHRPQGIALHRLPPQLRVLARVMGEAAAYRLVQALGGTPLSVPASTDSGHFDRLVDICGSVAAAAALVAELPGQRLELPKYDSVLRQLRHQRVVELRTLGKRLDEIALATAYGKRQVINILNAAGLPEQAGDADEPPGRGQGDLFEEQAEDEGVQS
jgi:hypothetical protein